jgi:ABC-type methionine transport system permease subunit
MANEAKLVIFEAVEPEPEFLPDGRPVQARLIREAIAKINEVSVDTLRQNLGVFFGAIGQMLEAAPKIASGYTVDKVEIHCQVSADGKIGVAGAGMGLKGDTGIKFVFQRAANS